MEIREETIKLLDLTNLEVVQERFVSVEYGLLSFLSVLDVLEEFYEVKDKKDLHALTTVTMRHIRSIQEEFTETLSDLERCILDSKSLTQKTKTIQTRGDSL